MIQKLTGSLNFSIEYDDKTFSISFDEDMSELDSTKNALAAVSFAQIVSENTLKFMEGVKESNRPLYNAHYKSHKHNVVRLISELKSLQKGIISDLAEQVPPVENKVTIQNPIIEE